MTETAVKVRGEEEQLTIGQRLPLWIFRITALAAGLAMFFPPVNPGRISEKINQSASLFTTGISYGTITNSMGRILRSQWIRDADITLLMISCCVLMAGIIASAVGGCMSLGNRKMRWRGMLLPLCGSLAMAAGLWMIRHTYDRMLENGTAVDKLDRINLMIPSGFWVFAVLTGLIFLTSLLSLLTTRRETDPEIKMDMDEKYRETSHGGLAQIYYAN